MRIALAVLLIASVFGCTDDQAGKKTEEPVQPKDESLYPVDKEYAPPAEGDGAASANADAPPAATPETESDEPTGTLTDDPVGAPKDLPKMKDDGTADPSESAPHEESYTGSFESDLPAEPGQDDPSAEANGTPQPPLGGEIGRATAGSVVKYVDAKLLNVRSGPNLKSPIVKRILGGAKVHAQIKGEYAKIGNGQWVKSKFLSDTPTPQVSASEAEQAWAGSKFKDNWKAPPKKKGAKAKAKPKGKAKVKPKGSNKAKKKK